MLEILYDSENEVRSETDSAMNFYNSYVNSDEAEDKFFEAIRDTRLAGFREGMNAALTLFAEVQQGA